MYNKITLMGRLVAAPELKTTQNGIPYTRFRIAVNRRFHSKDEEIRSISSMQPLGEAQRSLSASISARAV